MYDKTKEFWQSYPMRFSENDFLKQVGRTIEKKPISMSQFEAILFQIRSNLLLNRKDTLIDICCGNGFITKNIAKNCALIDGIDYSEYLINIALKYNCLPNTRYWCCSLFDMPNISDLSVNAYDKVLIYNALPNFLHKDIMRILSILDKITHSKSLILLGDIPDIQKKWHFYNTPQRRKDYFQRIAEENEAIGTWWDKSELFYASELAGFKCEFRSQSDNQPDSHYRFDAILRKSQ